MPFPVGRPFAHALHLTRRFVEVARGRGPDPTEDRWAEGQLDDAAVAYWRRLEPVDRAHSIGVARRVVAASPDAPGWVVVAALLHDVGKGLARANALERALLAIAAAAALDRHLARFADRSGRIGELARYVDYPERGATALRSCGQDARVVAWAAEHHRSRASWSIDPDWADILSAADRGS